MESIDTTNIIATEQTPLPSVTSLVGFDLAKLRALVNDIPELEQEDETYFTVALQHLHQAKELKKTEDYLGAMKAVNKAVKRISELVQLRVEKGYPNYKVFEAPFIYQQGNILVSYIENKADVFGNIPELNLDFSDDEEEDGAEEGEDGAESGEEQAPEAAGDAQPAEVP